MRARVMRLLGEGASPLTRSSEGPEIGVEPGDSLPCLVGRAVDCGISVGGFELRGQDNDAARTHGVEDERVAVARLGRAEEGNVEVDAPNEIDEVLVRGRRHPPM